uniref:Uncharacterized protein n=1 Tax=Escherichia coli TaxID=562 RepID=A0A075MBY9_ECOLX|nr:hypothetical protein [Escherichia coli]UFD95538.1 hypothetical protein [Escherichia coli]
MNTSTTLLQQKYIKITSKVHHLKVDSTTELHHYLVMR